MNVDLGGCCGPDRNVDRLVLDEITGCRISAQRHAARAPIDVDAGRPRRGVVGDICPVAGDIVVGNQVSGEDCAGLMGMHRDSGLAVADHPVADNDIVVSSCLHRGESRWAGRGEDAHPGAIA